MDAKKEQPDVTLYERKKADRWGLAKALSTSDLCPKQFRGKPADIAIVLHQAETLGCDPQSALQNVFVVKGTPGYSSKFLIALANRSGVFRGPIRFRYEGTGNALTVTAWAKLAEDGGIVESIPVSMELAKNAGWTSNDAYQKTPALMLAYRAAAFLIRLSCPEVTMGMLSVEELQDMAHYPASASAEATATVDAILRGSTQRLDPVEAEDAQFSVSVEAPVEVEVEVEDEGNPFAGLYPTEATL